MTIITKNKITCRRGATLAPEFLGRCQMEYSPNPDASSFAIRCRHRAVYVYAIYVGERLMAAVELCLECAEVVDAMELDGRG